MKPYKSIKKLLVGICLLSLIVNTPLITFGQSQATTPAKQISLSVNQIALNTDVPPLIFDGRVFVPFRRILETLGASVIWDSESQTAFAIKSPISMALRPGSPDAFINGIPVPMEAPVRIIDGRVLVPLRFVSERLGATVIWNDQSRSVSIVSDTMVATDPPATVADAVHENVGLNSPLDALLSAKGQPQHIMESQYGFYWYVYHDQYKNLQLYGIRNQMVVAHYSNLPRTIGNMALSPQSRQSDVRKALGTPITTIQKNNVIYSYQDKNVDIFKVGGDYLHVFYDHISNSTTIGYLWLSTTEQNNLMGYYGTLTPEVLVDHEYMMFLLINSSRVEGGLAPLAWAKEVQPAARAHSRDMALNQYFGHVSPSGSTPIDRIQALGIPFQSTAENLAAGQFDALHAHNALLNSPGHRANIFGDFVRLGVGIASGGPYQIYYTNTYYTPQ